MTVADCPIAAGKIRASCALAARKRCDARLGQPPVHGAARALDGKTALFFKGFAGLEAAVAPWRRR